MKVYVYVCIIINAVWCNADILEKLQICKRSDPKINDCLKTAIQNALSVLEKGFPEFNIPAMQPMEMSELKFPAAPPLNFAKEYTNIELYNHASTQITQVSSKISDAEFFLGIKGFNPLVKFISDYEFIDAFFAGVDLSGKGKTYVECHGYHVQINFTGELKKKSNENFLTITNSQINIDADDLVVSLKTGKGDVDLLLETFLPHVSKVMFPLLKDDFAEIYAEEYKELANSIFSLISYDKLFPM